MGAICQGDRRAAMGGLAMGDDASMGAGFDQYDVMNEYGVKAVEQVQSLLHRAKPSTWPDFIEEQYGGQWRKFISLARKECKAAKVMPEKSDSRTDLVKRFMNRLLLVKVRFLFIMFVSILFSYFYSSVNRCHCKTKFSSFFQSHTTRSTKQLQKKVPMDCVLLCQFLTRR